MDQMLVSLCVRSRPGRVARSWLLGGGLFCAVHALPAAPLVLDLPAQELGTSLRVLAQRAGLSLQVSPQVSLQQRAPALQGTLELDEALRRLLADAGVSVSASAGVLRVVPADTGPQRIDIVGTRLGVDVAERVQRAQASDVRDLFTGEAAAQVGGGTRNSQRLYLRGVEASQLNLTIDGARQGANLHNHRGGLANVDPELVKRVELKPGPPAADDGYGALGGSVRFETIDAQDRLGPAQRTGGVLKLGGASANELGRVGAGVFARVAERRAGDVGVLAYASASRYGETRIGGGGRVPFSGGRDESAMLKLSALELGAHSVRAGVEQHRATGLNFLQRGDFPYQVQPSVSVRPPLDQALTRTVTTLRWDWDPGHPWWRLRATMADGRNDFHAPGNNGERAISRVRNLDLRNEWRLERGAWGLRTTVGADAFSDQGSSELTGRETVFTRTENRGLYVQGRLSGERYGLEAGVRRDEWRTRLRTRESEGAATSLNLQGEVALPGGLGLFGGVGESARGYSTLPMQFTRNIVAALQFNGSTEGTLRGETARLAEAGVRWRGQGVLLSADRVALELKAYDNRIRDAILYRQPGSGGLGGRPVTDFYNFDRTARFHGWEASTDWSAAEWATRLTLARPQVRDLPPEPQFIARFGAPTGAKLVWDTRWQVRPALLLGYTLTAARRVAEVPVNQAVFIPRAGYALHNVQLVWRPARPAWGAQPTLALAVNNLADRRYSSQVTFTERGFATEEPGRNLRLTASLAW